MYCWTDLVDLKLKNLFMYCWKGLVNLKLKNLFASQINLIKLNRCASDIFFEKTESRVSI